MTSSLEAAIVGAAITPVGVWPDETSFGLAARALTDALQDAGLDRSQLDGFVWNLGRPSGEDYDAMLSALGLRARFVTQFWTHGRFTGSSILVAAMAVTCGLADYVVCIGGTKRSPTTETRAPIYGTSPYGDVERYGMTSFVHEAAIALQSYLAIYDVDRDRLADVVLAAHDHASLNPGAAHQEALTLDAYLNSPFVVEPLRQLDCFPFARSGAPINDYGACVIVSGREAAHKLGRKPIYIAGGQGIQGGRDETYFGRPGLGVFGQTTSSFEPSAWDKRAYGQTGIGPSDIDVFFTYDCFASLVWMSLERFGHCEPGSAPDWVTRERIGPGGGFPVNPNGGLLAEGHTAGWGHIVELTRQLRGEAGARQVPEATVAQWASVFGDSVLFTNAIDWRRD